MNEIKYSKAIAKELTNAVEYVKDYKSFDQFETIEPYLSCRGFLYANDEQRFFVRDCLLMLWSRLLLMLKKARFADQCTIYKYISSIVLRSEFLLEDCGFQDINTPFDDKTQHQLDQFHFLLKLSLLYTNRALVCNVSKTRDFAFAVITIAMLHFPEYRVCFLTRLQSMLSVTSGNDESLVMITFQTSSSSFIDKYLTEDVLSAENEGFIHFKENNRESHIAHHPSRKGSMASTDRVDDKSNMGNALDEKKLASTIPPAYIFRSDQVVYKDEQNLRGLNGSGKEDYCYDDHHFGDVNIDDDISENPYSTQNIKDILRNHSYSLNYNSGGEDETNTFLRAIDSNINNILPPLRLPDMNNLVDFIYDRYMYSRETELLSHRYVYHNPSQFCWEYLCRSENVQLVEDDMYINRSEFRGYDNIEVEREGNVYELTKDETRNEIVGDLYLNMDFMSLFERSHSILSQFITFYMEYIKTISYDEMICWPIVPGYFIMFRVFLSYFQEFYMSKLSSGILRMNVTPEHRIRDAVAYSLLDACVVDGDVFNIVLSILFDKCNTSVFLDISKSLMVLHSLLKAIRKSNLIMNYTAYDETYYTMLYETKEVRLLLYLQDSNKDEKKLQSSETYKYIHSPCPKKRDEVLKSTKGPLNHESGKSNSATKVEAGQGQESIFRDSRKSSTDAPTKGLTDHLTVEDSPDVLVSGDLGLQQYDALAHNNSYYNKDLAILYTQRNALDQYYDQSINDTLKKKGYNMSYSSSRNLNREIPSSWKQQYEDAGSLEFRRFESYTNPSSASASASASASVSTSVPVPNSAALSLQPSSSTLSFMLSNTPHKILPTFREEEENEREIELRSVASDTHFNSCDYGEIKNRGYFVNRDIQGFTQLQAIFFLLENNVIKSRGEGLDFLTLLQDRRVLRPIRYDRRFKTTFYQISSRKEIMLFKYPEISEYNHKAFEGKVNYCYIMYVLGNLIKMAHVQVLEKVLTFIYFNEDFFSGEHRLQLYSTVIFPHFSLFFTHWNPNIRHLFHRLIIFKMCKTRHSYLPGYYSIEIHDILYSLIFEHKREMRKQQLKNRFGGDTPVVEEEDKENNVYAIDEEIQTKIQKAFNCDTYDRFNSRNAQRTRTQKLIYTMELSSCRETQYIDMKLSNLLKTNLHILLNINNSCNRNRIENHCYIQANQFKYYWISLAEYLTLLSEYEKIDLKTKPCPLYEPNIYNSGVGIVEGTTVPWSVVNEMETPVEDVNIDIEFFLVNISE